LSVGASRWFARIGSPEPVGALIESSLRREVFEELGIEIEIVRLTKVDAVPYVPEEPGQGFS
jgi:8-oxo-dGTP pyrophosphatase MutT (NUDIX family)